MTDVERMVAALERIVVLLEKQDQRAKIVVTDAPPFQPPAQAAPAAPQATVAGVCPVHGTPWRTSKKNGTPSKRGYCSGKLADGSYCSEQGPWLG